MQSQREIVNEQRDKYRLERTFELTPSQIAAFRREARGVDLFRNAVSRLVSEILDEVAERDEAMWDKLAELVGFDSWEDSLRQRRVLIANWQTGMIEVRDATALKGDEATKDA